MKVAFVIGGLGVGGAERQLAMLAAGLRQRGHDVLVVSSGDGPWRTVLERNGVDVRCFPATSFIGTIRQRARMVRELRRQRTDVLHPYLTSTNAWVTALTPLISPRLLVWGVRDSGTQTHATSRGRMAWWLSRRMSRRADLVIFNSAAGASNYRMLGYAAAASAVVPNGIDTERFRPDEELRARWRQELALGPDAIVIGMIARDDAVKGHEDLVAAAARLRQLGDAAGDAVVVIAGGVGPTRTATLRTVAARAGVDLRLLPPSTAPEEFYNGIDVFVMPSRRSEGFPNVLGEAMACGRAAVVTDVGDARSVLDGHGVVVRPNDVADLASGIGRAVEQIAAASSDACRRVVIDRYSVERLVEVTEALLLEHLGRRSAARR